MTSKKRSETNPAPDPGSLHSPGEAGAVVDLVEKDCDTLTEVPSESSAISGKVRDVFLLRDRIMNPGPIACTRSHDVIRNWASDRQARPAASAAENITTLCFAFPGSEEKNLEEIDWAEWFTHFDEAGYIFLYEEKPGGAKSNFYQFGRPKD